MHAIVTVFTLAYIEKLYPIFACVFYVGGPTVHDTSYNFFRKNYILKLECQSKDSIATNVVWLMDDTVVDISHTSYQRVQIVNTYSQAGSYMHNILIVNDLLGALGRHTYTCIVENTFGSDSEDISINKEGKLSLDLYK